MPLKITIDEELQKKLPEFGIISKQIAVKNKQSIAVASLLKETSADIRRKYQLDEVTKLPKIKEGRDAYKKLGKDPSHLRLACEALIRRAIRGLQLYTINDVVDLGNILSLITMRSVCVVDADKIKGDIHIRIGKENEPYQGINRGMINISNIPVYTDAIGPFGNPSSDTLRSAVDMDTTNILIMIICFSKQELKEDEEKLNHLFSMYINK